MLGTRMSAFFKLSKRDLKYDFPASIVVFLVALPLCLGIAMASGAPLFAGILTGIIGGTVVASISKSPLSVSGPAAGLTVIVLTAIQQLGDYQTFLLAVVLAGGIQIVMGLLKAGIIGNYFPSAVIVGMLAAIGITIILKQLPLAFGWESFNGISDLSIAAPHWLGPLPQMAQQIGWGSFIICSISILILLYWPKIKYLNKVPAPLMVVLLGIGLALAFNQGAFAISANMFVQIPVVESVNSFFNLFMLPNFSAIFSKDVWVVAGTLAIIASLETLLSIEAIDKIDPFKRNTPTNRELFAQGVGNMTAGMLGGLPLTSVIVRSSANANAGGRTRQSAMLHALWLLIALLLIPVIINMIPLASLAAILLHTGYKLAQAALFKQMWKKGLDQFIPFIVTILAVVFTDLLTGVGIGLLIAMFYILKNNMINAFSYRMEESPSHEKMTMVLAEEVSFLNKASIQKALYSLPKTINEIEINGSRSRYIDKDVIEVIEDFEKNAISKGIKVQLNDIVNFKALSTVRPWKRKNQRLRESRKMTTI
jgi:MFS superfamily sulfate permease-like transporter